MTKASGNRQKIRSTPMRVTNLYDQTVDYVMPPPKPQRSKRRRADPAEKRHTRRRHTLNELGYASYNDYLQSPHWRAKRVELARSGRSMTCVSCGKNRIHVHHRTYDRVGAELLDDLDCLCERCHELAHKAAQTLTGVTLWNCSRKVANLIRLEFGTPRFDEKAWTASQQVSKKVTRSKTKRISQTRKIKAKSYHRAMAAKRRQGPSPDIQWERA